MSIINRIFKISNNRICNNFSKYQQISTIYNISNPQYLLPSHCRHSFRKKRRQCAPMGRKLLRTKRAKKRFNTRLWNGHIFEVGKIRQCGSILEVKLDLVFPKIHIVVVLTKMENATR